MEKMKIGVVVAIEIDAVCAKYGEPDEICAGRGSTVRLYREKDFDMYVVDSGAGEIAAAAGTQMLIDRYGVDMILNFGVVGAVTEDMRTAELCVVDSIIHYDFDTTGWLNLARGQYPGRDSAYIRTDRALLERAEAINPTIRRAVCASADKFVDRAEDKTVLREKYGADICEMEAAGIALTCERNGVPCLLIKAISDCLTGGGAEFMTELARVSKICFEVVDELIHGLCAAN